MDQLFLFSRQQDIETEIEQLLGETISPLDVDALVPPAEDLTRAKAVAIIEWVRAQVDREGKQDVVEAGAATSHKLDTALQTARADELRQGLLWDSPALNRLAVGLEKLEHDEERAFLADDQMPDDSDFFEDILDNIRMLED